jgi:hypothetical protein
LRDEFERKILIKKIAKDKKNKKNGDKIYQKRREDEI